jgi:hypothetical protein
LFDFAFKEYGRRWAFKRPTPADLFRTMEDASSVDLDWFWRGWFYTNDKVDMSLKDIEWFQISSGDPDVEKALDKANEESEPKDLSLERDKTFIESTRLENRPELNDHYTTVDPYEVMDIERKEYQDYLADLDEEELKMLSSGKHFYQLTFENLGGLVMPLVVEFTYSDGTTDVRRIPVEIWRKGAKEVTKVFVTPKEATRIVLDPFLEMADTDLSNNAWPRNIRPTRIDLYNDATSGYGRSRGNPMQRRQDNLDYIESLQED